MKRLVVYLSIDEDEFEVGELKKFKRSLQDATDHYWSLARMGTVGVLDVVEQKPPTETAYREAPPGQATPEKHVELMLELGRVRGAVRALFRKLTAEQRVAAAREWFAGYCPGCGNELRGPCLLCQ